MEKLKIKKKEKMYQGKKRDQLKREKDDWWGNGSEYKRKRVGMDESLIPQCEIKSPCKNRKL